MTLLLTGAGGPADAAAVDPSYTTLLAKLVAQYKFNASNFLDNSSNAYTLTKGSTAVFGNTAGDFYYSPDGTGANTDSGGPSTFANINSQDFSISCTFNFGGTTDMQILTNGLNDGLGATFNFAFGSDSTGNIKLSLRKAVSPSSPIVWSGGLGVAVGAYSATTLTHFLFSYVAATKTLTVYKNGTLVGTATHATAWAPSGSVVAFIGCGQTGTTGLVSDKLYNVLVFNAATTQTEATYLNSNREPF